MKKTFILPIALLLLSLSINVHVHAQGVDTLYEMFTGDCDSASANGFAPSNWFVYNVVGPKYWKCENYGISAGDGCESINGYEGGANWDSDDWLISPQLNLSHDSAAFLNFFANCYAYTGAPLQVMVTNSSYVNLTSPESSSYSWTTLPVIYDDTAGVTSDTISSFYAFERYVEFSVNLTPYKSSPMFVAIRYLAYGDSGSVVGNCSTWEVDSVFTTSTHSSLGVKNINNEQLLSVQVLGNATNNLINLSYTVNEAGNYTFRIYDMMGREVYTKTLDALQGLHTLPINDINFSSGMYIIKMTGSNGYGFTKVSIH